MIYFDNAATTPISPNIKKMLAQAYTETYGNPSSVHVLGKQASALLEQSRQRIASVLAANPANIYFSSGATESANIILQGYAQFLKKTNNPRNEIIISAIEHPAVDKTASFLEKYGFVVKKVGVDQQGIIVVDQFKSLLTAQTAMVAFIHTNNEIGTVQDIAGLARICKEKDPAILFVTDIVQAVGKVPLNLTPDIDAYFVSGHKIGAPKGLGFFYLNQKFRIQPIIYGGGQESGYRPGTTSPVNALLLAEAIEDRIQNLEATTDHVLKLNTLFTSELDKQKIKYQRTIDAQKSSPFILSIALPDSTGEFILEELSQRGICISQGSACSSNNHVKSRILEAIGLPDKLLDATVRISFSPENTEAEVLEVVAAIKNIV